MICLKSFNLSQIISFSYTRLFDSLSTIGALRRNNIILHIFRQTCFCNLVFGQIVLIWDVIEG